MPLFKTISDLRREFKYDKFDIDNADKDPFIQFQLWFDEAVKAGFLDPNAMVLTTSSTDGKPSSRYVLLKKFDENGFVFYTNYESRKGRELEENPNAFLLFYWDKLGKQVRIEGKCEKVSAEESDEYFQTRPYESRLGAWASHQSRELKSRFSLLRDVARLMAKYPKHVPLPPYWGGYRLRPELFEFWQGRESRLHDRLQYTKSGSGWNIERLYP